LIDPELATEILKRIKDFPQTDMGSVIMDIFGPSLLTSNGETWARQRKLIAPNVNEKISGLVFGESIRQAREMLSAYMEDWQGVTDDTMRGCKKIAINVLGLAGFGIPLRWKEEKSRLPEGYHMTYMDATKMVVEK
jgi:cytochrome P450